MDIKIWDKKIDPDHQNFPFDIEEITGAGYICLECKNKNNFNGEFHIYRLYNKEDNEWDFESEMLVPVCIECYECGSNNIIIEYRPNWAFSVFKDGDDCYHLTLISNKILINFEDSEGYFKLFGQLGCNKDMRNNSSSIMNEMAEWELNDWDSINSDTSAVVVRITAKNGMEQNKEGIYDNSGTYKFVEIGS